MVEAFGVLAAYWRETEPPANDTAEQEQRVAILLNNIFGTDLDKQAVEIAQLNLMLVALRERSLLPDLSENIVVGNSLVDYSRPDAFDFGAAFPFEANPGRFHLVIGNPPYIRSQLLSDMDRDYYRGRYQTAKGSFDTYALFLERALELTLDGGRIGFIVPGKFISSSSGESALLEHLYETGNIELVLDAMRFKVFENALTYPVIIVARRGEALGGSDRRRSGRRPGARARACRSTDPGHRPRSRRRPCSRRTREDCRLSGRSRRTSQSAIRILSAGRPREPVTPQ